MLKVFFFQVRVIFHTGGLLYLKGKKIKEVLFLVLTSNLQECPIHCSVFCLFTMVMYYWFHTYMYILSTRGSKGSRPCRSLKYISPKDMLSSWTFDLRWTVSTGLCLWYFMIVDQLGKPNYKHVTVMSTIPLLSEINRGYMCKSFCGGV